MLAIAVLLFSFGSIDPTQPFIQWVESATPTP
jgi:hypothetical protein